MRVIWRSWCFAVGLAAASGWPARAQAQRVDFPSEGAPTPTTVAGEARGTARAEAPRTTLAPIPPRPESGGSARLGNPTFDPYHTGDNPGTFQPALPPESSPSDSGGFGNRLFGGGQGAAAGFPAPTHSAPSLAPPPGGSLLPPESSYPPSVYPNAAPPALFPGGISGAPGLLDGVDYGMPEAFRFLQGPRLRHTWISGGDGRDELGINTTDTSIAFAFPNFLYSGEPVYILPSFSLHLWDGPESPPGDLPGQAYDAFLEGGWQTDPNQILGAELGLSVGVFSDFETMNSDSLRVRGRGLGKLRLTQNSTLKLGVMYVDRNDVKILPAGGWLWQPGPATRFDIFFPNPKLSRYVSTIGTHDVWIFAAGEYGGGSWTIERANGASDSIDINDIRLSVGLEWGRGDQIRAGRRFGFIEAGWVFDREIEYQYHPPDRLELNDAVMVRAGIAY